MPAKGRADTNPQRTRKSATRRLAYQSIAADDDYPVVEAPNGTLAFDSGRFDRLVRRVIAEGNEFGAYEALYMHRGLRDYSNRWGYTLDGVLADQLRQLCSEQNVEKWTEARESTVGAAKALLDGFGATFADCGIEFILHDARNPLLSVIAIQNTITHRTVLDPNTNFGRLLIRRYARDRIVQNFCSYELEFAGKPVKSSTFPLIDRYGTLVALFCVNIDISWREGSDDHTLAAILTALAATSPSEVVDELISRPESNRRE
ncbi:MAG: PAS domain-containing protein [Angustibacter sp.]